MLHTGGTVSAAIFSSTAFDATMVNPSTVRLAGAPALRSGVEDADGDGRADLVVHFARAQLQLTSADTEAALTGATFAGKRIAGHDRVRVLR